MDPAVKLNLGIAQDFHNTSKKGYLDLYPISRSYE